jgi:Fic family protein
MALKETLKQIDELQTKINSFGKLNEDVLKKINYKFRLDWNYHSNAMEGNSLTKEETRSVMINNITVEGKPLKDVLEVKGHDEVITTILKIGKGEVKLSEKRIEEIHKGIMHEDKPEQASKIGEWKKIGNHIYNYKGEKYDFTAPADVPDEIHKLLNWLNAKSDEIVSKNKNAIRPVLLAFEFHLKYVTIHPFYDGNGRTSRILMNLILVMFGYPPVIIRVNDKDVYNQYLADIQGYGGNPDLFFEFMGKLLIKSQELVLTAIEGGDIDEPDDLDKKILLLEKELSGIGSDNEVIEKLSADVFFKIYDGWLTDLLSTIIPTVQKFNKFFTGVEHYLLIPFAIIKFNEESPTTIIEKFKAKIKSDSDWFKAQGLNFSFGVNFGSLIKGGINTFRLEFNVIMKFEYVNYSISGPIRSVENNIQIETFIKERPLDQPMTKEEINTFNKSLGDTIFNHIDFYTKQKGIR